MKPIDLPHTLEGSIPTPNCYHLYKYPAYTFDRKYENYKFQKIILNYDYHLVLATSRCG